MTGYLPKENENINPKRYMHPYVYCSIFYNSQDMEATKVSINRKEDVVYINNEILLSHNKEFSLAICNNMDGSRGYIMLSEISQTER